jgi:hypothetical protein
MTSPPLNIWFWQLCEITDCESAEFVVTLRRTKSHNLWLSLVTDRPLDAVYAFFDSRFVIVCADCTSLGMYRIRWNARTNLRSEFPTPKRSSGSWQLVYANSSRGAAPTFTGPHSLYFYLWGHPKPLFHSTTVENEETFHQRIFMPAKPFAIASGPLKGRNSSWWDKSWYALI